MMVMDVVVMMVKEYSRIMGKAMKCCIRRLCEVTIAAAVAVVPAAANSGGGSGVDGDGGDGALYLRGERT